MKGVDPFAVIFDPPYEMDFVSAIVDMLDETIGHLTQTSINGPKGPDGTASGETVVTDREVEFAILAEKDGDPTPLLLHGLRIEKLYEHVVMPYEDDRPFFIGGVPVERKNLRRIKIIRQDAKFSLDLLRLHNRMKNPRESSLYTPVSEYPGRLLALFQERNLDVTSDIINAYREKKKLKLPTDKLIEAASQLVVAAIRSAG
jgi:hypothetical protein